MAIRPIDVRRKEFKSGFRGYDANQVDDFLDSVADEFERTYAENRRITEELTVLKGRLEQFEELEGAIREALVHAQQVARDLRRNANKEAELTVREAKEQAHRILADSSARVERVQESYEVLRKAKQDFNNDFRHLLKTYADVMENADIASAKEIEGSLRERLDTESIAVARQAAETQQMEAARIEVEAAQDAPEPQEEAAPDDATQRIEAPPTTPEPVTPDETAASTAADADEPEVDLRKESSGAQGASDREEVTRREAPFAPAEDSGASDEVDREEPMPAGEGRTSDDFFDKDREDQPEDREEEGRIFRASRFLRRRA
ncbi:MAG TPA: DivIVA domain-containing protein [Rubrobacteraceae bacterium]|nr:DivIVA domain-containing protein [Rubrobacteraceae bacterium]